MITCYACDKTVRKMEFSPAKIKKMKKCVFWIDFEKPSHKDVKPLESLFGLHHLVVEDCISPQEKIPKIADRKTYSHIVLYAAQDHKLGKLNRVNFILGKNFIITMHKNPIEQFNQFKKNKENMNSLMKATPDKILHTLIDKIIDNYFPMLDETNEQLDVLEDKVVENPQEKHLGKLFSLKRDIMKVKKIMGPQRDVLSLLAKGNNKLISEKTVIYFRDIYDHMIWINDQLDSARDIISSILEIHLSVTSNKMNEIMKVLTVIATIMLPLTVIGSIYGMNFKYMPELQWRYGYLGVWVVMILIAVGMLYYFKRKEWL